MYAKVINDSICIYTEDICVYSSSTISEFRDGLEYCKTSCIPICMAEDTRQHLYEEYDVEIPRYLMFEPAS